MLDPTILLNLQPAMPPARPETTIERQHLPPHLEAVQRLADRKASQYEEAVAAWAGNLQKQRDYLGAVAPSRQMSEDELAVVTRVIDDIETEAELRAGALRRLVKRIARSTKPFFATSAAAGAAARSFGNRLVRADEQAIEALLEHALYLRAFRAARSPGARGGPVFDDPDALDSYLKAELA